MRNQKERYFWKSLENRITFVFMQNGNQKDSFNVLETDYLIPPSINSNEQNTVQDLSAIFLHNPFIPKSVENPFFP